MTLNYDFYTSTPKMSITLKVWDVDSVLMCLFGLNDCFLAFLITSAKALLGFPVTYLLWPDQLPDNDIPSSESHLVFRAFASFTARNRLYNSSGPIAVSVP